MGRDLDIAIIGTGLMGSQHAASLVHAPGMRLSAVCSPDAAGRQRLSEAHDVPGFTLVEDLLEDARPDGVIIATPTDTHAAVAHMCIDAGVHVFVEKPIDRTWSAAKRLVERASAANVALQVGHAIRYFPEYQAVGELIETGRLGTIGVATMGRACPQPDWTVGDWHQRFERGGGAVLDMMIHDIDLVRWYFGEPERVYAETIAAREDRGGIDYALATLRVPDGPICHLHASWAEPQGFFQTLEVCGSRGMVAYDSRRVDDLRIARHGTATDAPTALPAPQGVDPFQTQLADFRSAIVEHKPPPADGEWALHSLAICLAMIESSRIRDPVDLHAFDPVEIETAGAAS